MDELKKLEQLSLISKVCTELENHLGISDKDLGIILSHTLPRFKIYTAFNISAEFVIALAKENTNFQNFKKSLTENGADFSVRIKIAIFFSFGIYIITLQDSLIGNLLRIIQHMTKFSIAKETDETKVDKDLLSSNFPGLAIPNDFKTTKEQSPENDAEVSDAMAALSALAPATTQTYESFFLMPKIR